MSTTTNLSAGRPYLAIPGPSVIPDAVLQAMHRPSPNIYAGELLSLTDSLIPDLKALARTEHFVAIYIANGHGAWEAALTNTLQPGDKVLVPASGRFAIGWSEMAAALGIEIEILDFGTAAPWDLEQVAARLRADPGHQIKAVLGVHVDTSSSIRNDVAGLRAVMDAAQHPALLMADCIASLGCDRFEMDAWGVDVMVSACQKGLMTPAGMSFVFFNDKAAAARAKLSRVSRYWDWTPRANPAEFYQYFGGTAPTHHLYGLRAALDLVQQEGLEQVWARHARLAEAIWAACESWGAIDDPMQGLRLNVVDRALRSHAVTALHLPAPSASNLRQWLEENLGLTLGIGLGLAPAGSPEWHGHFRLGHMGYVNGHMIMGLLGGIETGLKALHIPHGQGALAAAATVLARPA
ncbi:MULTISPECIES: pyridoxal-phosphate-dependent aminotransferase family protein [Pseudophaeobacter]|jgi:alanine-glyoxylate transaminase/serine-glyoxylate transaminase/serine-pyruvate transaminase|uniref:pyridoxal-phosphate-dependent aminotransferase family protein n=1 Tax=Pseudophaeobacter TaxID=1541822 RepID=UPI00242CFF64|nr:aminotransferase class V-fold PLP-dependent enzyme [Pseudophaeobacter profundi]